MSASANVKRTTVGVHPDLAAPWQLRHPQPRQHRQAPASQHETADAAEDRQQQRLRQDLPAERRQAGAKGQPRRHLLHARARSYEHEVGDIHRANQQNEEHAGPQEEQRAADFAHEVGLKRRRCRVESGIGQDFPEGGEALHVARIERVELLLRLRDRGPRLEPADHRPVVAVPRVVRSFFRRERQRHPQLDLGIDEREVGREDTDNRVRLAIDPHGRADGTLARREELLPEPVRQHHLPIAALFAFLLGEDPSTIGLDAEHAQQRGPCDEARHALRIAAAGAGRGNRQAAGVVERLLREDIDFTQAVVVVGHAVRGPFDAGARVTVEDTDELLRLGNGQRPEEHRVDDREDRGVGADAHGQRQQRRQRERSVPPQQANGKFRVTNDSFHKASIRPTVGHRSTWNGAASQRRCAELSVTAG